MDEVGEDKSETKLKCDRVRQKVSEITWRQKISQQYSCANEGGRSNDGNSRVTQIQGNGKQVIKIHFIDECPSNPNDQFATGKQKERGSQYMRIVLETQIKKTSRHQ